MTKLNHNRPNLRYLDNLRRELGRDDRPAPSWFEPDRIQKFDVQLAEPKALPGHILDFGKLDPKQQAIAGYAIESFGLYLDASSLVISLLISGNAKKRKAAKHTQDVALENLVVSGAVLVDSILNDMSERRHGFWQWFQKFYAGLDQQAKISWADFAEVLMSDSLQLWFAQKMADTPDGVDRWRKFLSTDNWE